MLIRGLLWLWKVFYEEPVADLLGGQVDFTVDLGAAIPHIKSGKLRLLAVPDRNRSALFPDTPPFRAAVRHPAEPGWARG